jgi:phage/plasmid-associated DNA primase
MNGNNRLSFPVGDRAGGLARRLMLLEMRQEHVIPEAERDPELRRIFIEEEGPQILTWLLEGAYEALEKGLHHFRAIAAPMIDEARQYIAESDPHQQWMQNKGIIPGDPEKDYIRLTEAHRSYMAFRHDEDVRAREPLKTFKVAMEQAPMKWHWEKVGRGEPDKNKQGYPCAYGWKFSDDPTEG